MVKKGQLYRVISTVTGDTIDVTISGIKGRVIEYRHKSKYGITRDICFLGDINRLITSGDWKLQK